MFEKFRKEFIHFVGPSGPIIKRNQINKSLILNIFFVWQNGRRKRLKKYVGGLAGWNGIFLKSENLFIFVWETSFEDLPASHQARDRNVIFSEKFNI